MSEPECIRFRPEDEASPTQDGNLLPKLIDPDLTDEGVKALAEQMSKPEHEVRDMLKIVTSLESRVAVNQWVNGEDDIPIHRMLARLNLGNDATEEQIEDYAHTHTLQHKSVPPSDIAKAITAISLGEYNSDITTLGSEKQQSFRIRDTQQLRNLPGRKVYVPANGNIEQALNQSQQDQPSLDEPLAEDSDRRSLWLTMEYPLTLDANNGEQTIDYSQLNQPFTYEPLEKGHIRLLRLLPPKPGLLPNILLNVHIQEYPLNSAPEYHALSYAWETPGLISQRNSIALGGRTKEITLSLLVALTRMWEWRSDLCIWADGLCINQDDIAERNAQVGLMGTIYSRATLVLAYLGEPMLAAREDDILLDHTPFALMQMVLRVWEKTPGHGSAHLRPDSDWEMLNLPGQDGINDEKVRLNVLGSWIALLALCCQPWFTRAWVIQEVALAKEVLVFYGRAVHNLTILSKFWTSSTAGAYDLPPMMRYGHLADWLGLIENSSQLDVFTILRQVGRKRSEYLRGVTTNASLSGGNDKTQASVAKNQSTDLTLLTLLNITRRAGATDIRDKVYSLLSLAPDISSLGILPDYSPTNTAARVFRQVAEIYIQQGQGIQVLYQAGLHYYNDDKTAEEEDPTETKTLPSWVPDWGKVARRPLKEQQYCCMGDTTAPDIQISDNTLIVRGAVIDEVFASLTRLDFEQHRMLGFEGIPQRKFYRGDTDTCPEVPKPKAHEGWFAVLECMHMAVYAAVALTLSPWYEPSGESIIRAVWRTMRADTPWGQAKNWAYDDGDNDNELKDDEIDEAAFKAYTDFSPSNIFHGDNMPDFDETKLLQQAWPVFASIMRIAQGYCFGITSCGRFGLFPGPVRQDDLIVVMPGATMPFVLRPAKLDGSQETKLNDRKRFVLVGPCYIHGIMHGEALFHDDGNQEEDLEKLCHNAEGRRYRVGLRPWIHWSRGHSKKSDFLDPTKGLYARMEDFHII
ncbi:heterokaryon incompatibility protein-domain-containing protein [Cladorrhinum sp. PSN332]|nr:heterokaryon incompatibility protein-domain-containing protein [Cladorrhinum sp. PSN332]